MVHRDLHFACLQRCCVVWCAMAPVSLASRNAAFPFSFPTAAPPVPFSLALAFLEMESVRVIVFPGRSLPHSVAPDGCRLAVPNMLCPLSFTALPPSAPLHCSAVQLAPRRSFLTCTLKRKGLTKDGHLGIVCWARPLLQVHACPECTPACVIGGVWDFSPTPGDPLAGPASKTVSALGFLTV